MKALSTFLIDRAAPLNNGLVYWGMALPDGMGGGATTFKNLVRPIDGVLVGATKSTPRGRIGAVGGSILYEATNAVVEVPGYAAINSLQTRAFTCTAWIYPVTTGEGGTARIIDKRADSAGDGWIFFVDDTASLGFLTFDSGAKAQQRGVDNTITLNAWNFVMLTFDDNGDRQGHIYVKGSLTEIGYDTDTAANVSSAETGFLRIGDSEDDARTFDGNIDDVRLFNRVLAPIEGNSIYRDSLAGYPKTLAYRDNVAYLPVAAPVGAGDLLLTNRSIANYGGIRQ